MAIQPLADGKLWSVQYVNWMAQSDSRVNRGKRLLSRGGINRQ